MKRWIEYFIICQTGDSFLLFSAVASSFNLENSSRSICSGTVQLDARVKTN